MSKFFKVFRNSKFIGQQLSRFRMAMSYYSLFISTLSAIMLVKTAYPVIEIEWILLLSPIPVIATILIGWFMDTKNINTMDSIKSIEMTHRFLNTGDLKTQEFQLLQTEILLSALKSLKEGKDIDTQQLQTKYNQYISKWKSPYE